MDVNEMNYDTHRYCSLLVNKGHDYSQVINM